MKNTNYNFFDVLVWALVACLMLYVPSIETRVEEVAFDQPATREQPPTTAKPEDIDQYLKMDKCFHLSREQCPKTKTSCAHIGAAALFCCDLDSQKMKDILIPILENQDKEEMANTTILKYLHVLNATIDNLNVSAASYRRLDSMAFTDGNIGEISGEFRRNSAMACLNISSNNLTSAKLTGQSPFRYLFNLTVLDASANNLTAFPLSLFHSNRNISVDLSGNNYLQCKDFQKAMESNNATTVNFLKYENTSCALDVRVSNWIHDVEIVPIDYLRVQRELVVSCSKIKPDNINCTCVPERLEISGQDISRMVDVDCSRRHLKEMPTNLPANTVKLNVSYNNISSLEAVSSDPSYEHLRQLFLDYNDITNILELEGTKFIDTFTLFSLAYNKLKMIHTYVLSNRFDTIWPKLSVAGNSIHCDCNTEKMLKPWLFEFSKNIPDYKKLLCENMGAHVAVVDLIESQVCHTPRDWTDYIYYIIGLEVLILVLLISKVSYDYWVFKTAGYLPWPANKMPRLPCDWLCE